MFFALSRETDRDAVFACDDQVTAGIMQSEYIGSLKAWTTGTIASRLLSLREGPLSAAFTAIARVLHRFDAVKY